MIWVFVFIVLFSTVCAFIPFFNMNRGLLRRRQSTMLALTPKHKVTLHHAGIEHILEVAEDETILDASLDAGIELPYDCKCGVCLTCPSRIISGTVEQEGSTLDDSVMADGYALTCMCYPRSEIVIKSIDEQELLDAQFGENN